MKSILNEYGFIILKGKITLSLFLLILLSAYTKAQHGFEVEGSSWSGISVKDPGMHGIYITDAAEQGIYINRPTNNGVQVFNAGEDGIDIRFSEHSGIYMLNTGSNGANIQNPGGHGVIVSNTAEHGFYVTSTQADGLHINDADDDGIQIDNADDNGILVHEAGGHSINIQGTKNQANGITGHIAKFRNKSSGSSPDVLALQVETTNPGSGCNFVTFYNGSNGAVGRIEGNGSGGVLYGTSGADFAESLPRKNEEDNIEAGDIIGVSSGTVSHNTQDALQLMIITDRPAVLGNQDENSDMEEMVSFIGQVPVKVIGSVNQGDWIVPSGKNDGIGFAVPSENLTLKHRIVGRAWESNSDSKLKKVNCAVGLDQSQAKDFILKNMQIKLEKQDAINSNLQNQIDQLQKLISN